MKMFDWIKQKVGFQKLQQLPKQVLKIKKFV